MKRLIVLMLLACVLFSLAACGTSQLANGSATQKEEVQEPAQEEVKQDEIVVVDNEQVKFVITGIKQDGMLGCEIYCYIENNTDNALLFAWQNTSINGYMIDPFWGQHVEAGKKANSTILFMTESLKSNGIESVDEAEFNLVAMPESGEHSYDLDYAAVDDTFTVTFTG